MPLGLFKYKIPETSHSDFSAPQTRMQLEELRDFLDTDELLLLRYPGGCELFFVPGALPDVDQVRQLLQGSGLLPADENFPGTYMSGREVAGRFLKIAVGAAGVDGGQRLMEIFHHEYTRMSEWHFVGAVFHRLTQRGIWLHEKIRQETAFFEYAVEPATVIDELVQKVIGKHKKCRVAVVGGCAERFGIIRELHELGYRQISFWGNENDLPKDRIMQLDPTAQVSTAMPVILPNTGLMLVFDSATHRLSKEMVEEWMRQRATLPLLMVDFSDYSLNIAKLIKNTELYLYTTADIDKVIRSNSEDRRAASAVVEQWIDRELDAFYNWFSSEERYVFAGIVGASPEMQRIFEMISRIAQTDITVLIDGESGTGKELVAKAVHKLSARAARPLMIINCGAIPENLLESELFGHVKGAFTGAVAAKEGLFEAAHSGTVFLDEIGELPAHLQVKLLRVLQDGEVKRVGSNETIRVDVRMMAATNRDLAKMVEEGAFRSDLFYRLNVIQLTLPPLRQRADDIPLLVRHFVEKISGRLRKEIAGFAPEALEALRMYHWPGNVRELENVVERAMALAVGSRVMLTDLPQHFRNVHGMTNGSAKNENRTLKEVEKNHILETLDACDWNYEIASKQLGIGRTTLWRKLKEYNVVEKRNS